MGELSHQSNATTFRHRCPLCGAHVHTAHFKRHLGKHDREGIYQRATIDRAWMAFVDRETARHG